MVSVRGLAPSWGLLGYGLPLRIGCRDFQVLLARPQPPLLPRSAPAWSQSVRTAAILELVPLLNDPSLLAALLLLGRAPHIAFAFLRPAGVLRPSDLVSQCSRMEPASSYRSCHPGTAAHCSQLPPRLTLVSHYAPVRGPGFASVHRRPRVSS